MAKSGTNLKSSRTRINHLVFWPPFLLMLLAVGLNIASPKTFGKIVEGANQWVLVNLGWVYVLCAFTSLILCIVICFSKFGKVRIGGADAKPLMTYWNWFAITICTTIAVGILFWSTAEPLKHFQSPPGSFGIESESPEAARFSLSALYLHWSFTPYAIYCVASLMFAFAYYNMQLPFSLGSTLVPFIGKNHANRFGNLIDAVCLYSLVAGMAATLGTGILTISGGLHSLWEIPSNRLTWAIIAGSIVITFVISSATGLMKGIRILSDINAKALLLLALFVFVAGPTLYIFQSGIAALGTHLLNFFKLGLIAPLSSDKQWARDWSIFYWAVWLAWTPITACFLGRIAYGRTVREFMAVNFILPALFSMCWMAIFAATTLNMEIGGAGLIELMNNSGYEAVSYAVLRALPLGQALVVFYLVSAFVCFVTSADSNTTAMASISSRDVSLENPEGSLALKLAWGLLVGATAWVMISFANADGIKMISTLGGLPAAILLFFIIASLIRVLFQHEQLSVVDKKED